MRKIHKDVLKTLDARTPRRFDGGTYRVESVTIQGKSGDDLDFHTAWVAYHYATPIVMLVDGWVILNASPYSRTTSAFQKAARETFPRRAETDALDRGVSAQKLYDAIVR